MSITMSQVAFNTVINDFTKIPRVPKRLLTEDFCIKVVTYCGSALEYIPEHLRTPEVCRAAKDNC